MLLSSPTRSGSCSMTCLFGTNFTDAGATCSWRNVLARTLRAQMWRAFAAGGAWLTRSLRRSPAHGLQKVQVDLTVCDGPLVFERSNP